MACHTYELEAATGKDSTFRHLFHTEKEDDPIDSIFFAQVSPLTWYSLNPRLFLPSRSEGTDSCRYTPPTGFEYVMYSYLRERLPALSVKEDYADQYQIAWCRNIMHEIVEKADCKINDAFELQAIDKHWLIFEPEFYLEPGFEEEYDRGVGNDPEIQTFARALPSYKLRSDQPWFYCKYSEMAFPLFMIGSQSTFNHNYNFVLNIDSLLRMRYLRGDKWVDIKPDIRLLNGVPSDEKLPVPQLWGTFGKIRGNEVKARKCQTGMTFFTENIVCCDGDNPAKCGDTISVPLVSEGPCKAMIWAAHNSTCEALNIRSVYTTTIDGVLSEETPIRSTDLMFSKTKKFKDMENDHFTGSLVRRHFVRPPRMRGLNGFSFSYNSSAYGIEVGVQLTAVKGILKSKLADNNIEKWKNRDVDVRGNVNAIPCKDEFNYIVRLLVQRELVVSPDGEVSFVF